MMQNSTVHFSWHGEAVFNTADTATGHQVIGIRMPGWTGELTKVSYIDGTGTAQDIRLYDREVDSSLAVSGLPSLGLVFPNDFAAGATPAAVGTDENFIPAAAEDSWHFNCKTAEISLANIRIEDGTSTLTVGDSVGPMLFLVVEDAADFAGTVYLHGYCY